jgi:hypothetical protein
MKSISNKVILFFGYGNGTEYVLNPLYTYMMKQGYTCIELDMMKVSNSLDILSNLVNKEVIFVTSSHLFMDHKNFIQYVNIDEGEIISALEVIDLIKPLKSIYYPHDLVTPLLKQDLRWLSLFDVLLSPLPNLNHLSRYTEVVEVGWIKKDKMINPSSQVIHTDIKVALSLSNIRYYMNLGFDETYDIWKPIFDLGVGIKLPYWPGSEEFGKCFELKGVKVYPSNMNVYKLIEDHDIIITNSTTSVSIEAGLSGRMVLNVLDGVCTEQEQKQYTQGIACIETVTFDECVNEIKKLTYGERKLSNFKEVLLPFNYELASQILLD